MFSLLINFFNMSFYLIIFDNLIVFFIKNEFDFSKL